MTPTNLRNVAIAISTFACAVLLSSDWSVQGGISLSIGSAQAQIGRPSPSQSVARTGAGWAAGPWDYYGGSPCDYERTGGGYYRGAGWDRYWSCGPGAYCCGAGPW
jgi:hypothetical protein